MYKINILSDNDPGVLAKLCNLFSARGFNIITLHAQPVDGLVSSVEITAELDEEKLQNMKEKILQIVPVREVKVCKIVEV